VRQFARVYPGIVIDVVERDRHVIALARRWFLSDAIPNTRVHIADGARVRRSGCASAWRRRGRRRVTELRAYQVPLPSADFFADLRRALDPGGSVALNVIGTLGGRGPVRDVSRWPARSSVAFACCRWSHSTNVGGEKREERRSRRERYK
jgi:hypothetical protein